MNEKRAIAGAILDMSKKAVTTERGQQHGDAQLSFAAIGEIWVAYLNAASVRRTGIPLTSLYLSAADVAFMMVQMKQMRVLYGDETDPDNYVDAAGYTALAGMFAVPARRVAPGVSAAAPAPEQPPIPGTFYEFANPDGVDGLPRAFPTEALDALPELAEGSQFPYEGSYQIKAGDPWPTEGIWRVTHRLHTKRGPQRFLLKQEVEA